MAFQKDDLLNSFSKPKEPSKSLTTTLQSIWTVNADHRYDNIKPIDRSKNLVAVRTIMGKGCLILRSGCEFSLHENTLFFAERSQIRRYYCDGEAWNFFWFDFLSEKVYLPKFNKLYLLDYSQGEGDKINRCVNLLMSPKEFAATMASNEFGSLLAQWTCDVGSSLPENQDRIEQAMEYVLNNLDKNITVAELAVRSQMSERAFREAFKRHAGCSPKKYMEDNRLELAKQLLKDTDLQVKTISDLAGFSSPYYFSRTFRKRVGHSPTQQRRE